MGKKSQQRTFETVFHGTPAQFASVVHSISISLRQNSDLDTFPFIVMLPQMELNGELPDNTKRVDVDMADLETGSSLGFIRVQFIASGKSLLVATKYRTAGFLKFAELWKELMRRLDRLNLIENGAQVSNALTNEILPHLAAIKDGISDLKRGQAAIYRKVDAASHETLEQITGLIQAGRIDQGEMARTLDAIRRALRLLQSSDPEIIGMAQTAKEAVESDLGLEQKLELSLPIIPLFLQYKVELSANSETDLNAVFQEVLARWNALKQQAHK